MPNYQGKTAVITGAASGLGLALARRAAAEGMNLVLADIDEPTLQTAAASLGVPAERLLLRRTDVRHHSELVALADAAYGRFGAVHFLCNNAGVALARVTWEHTIKDWEWVLGVNLWSVIYGIDAFLPRMQAANVDAYIVNTASVAGLLSPAGANAYNVSKHGVVTLSETLFRELEATKSPVGVSVLCPAWVPTGISTSERNRPDDAGSPMAPGALSEAVGKRMAQAVASGHLSADDIANKTFEAMAERRFYIIPHRRINETIEVRMHDILNQRNPTPMP